MCACLVVVVVVCVVLVVCVRVFVVLVVCGARGVGGLCVFVVCGM